MDTKQVVIKLVDCDTVSDANTIYDAVIVGSGVAGTIVAKEIAEQGGRVLILEAGPGKELNLTEFQNYVNTFYSAVVKDNNSPFPINLNAPSPRSPQVRKLVPGQLNADMGYFVQAGPLTLDSAYTRVTGGTTTHWQATALRMLPDDFRLRSKYGQGLDWPIEYDHLIPYYEQAERELGVSGNAAEQAEAGVKFSTGYVYPMHEMPPSYLDRQVAAGLRGTEVELAGEKLELKLVTLPQARNGIPNKEYDGGKGFIPDNLASINPVQYGQRCQGNANCTPLCPVQAKYDGRRTLVKAFRTGLVELITQAVASKVEIDPETGNVTGICFKRYEDTHSPQHTLGVARGKIYVLAANAVENARLMLASNLPSTSGLMGKNLMDHPYLLAWALMPEVTGTMRGPLGTSAIDTFRKGNFRHQQSAFGIDIHNDGWGWATGSPYSDVLDVIDNKNKYGKELRHELISRISRQLLLANMCELPADPSNRVTVNPEYVDPLGNFRPVISFNISDYCLKTMAYARYISRVIFQRLGAEDYTHYNPADYGYFTYQGEGYFFRGGNHFSGTHVMGTNKFNSVVDEHLRSWDHQNLYLVGSGSMPSIGSSNTTLTLAALSFVAAEKIVDELGLKH